MSEISFQWKVDFALVLSLVALFITTIRWYFENRGKKKRMKIEAYEKVFDDAIFIILYPFKYKKEKAHQKEYFNDDPDFQKSVRYYLNSHYLSHSIGDIHKFVPSHINNQV